MNRFLCTLHIGLATIFCFISSTLQTQVVTTTATPFPPSSDDSLATVEEFGLHKRMQEIESQSAELREKIKIIEDANKQKDAAKTKLPSVTMSGVFQADGVVFDQDANGWDAYGRVEGGGDFRRARLGAKGSVTDRMDYFMQMDFAFFGRPTFTDVWVDFKDAGPLGTIRVGQWKQPFLV